MKILALDQATNITGYALFDGTDLCKYGVIDLRKEKDAWERMQIMRIRVDRLIGERKPKLVLMEDITFQRNPQTLIELGRTQGLLMSVSFAHGIPVLIYHPSRWRSLLHIEQGKGHKRRDLKRQAAEIAKNVYGAETTEDEADAISIGLAYLVESGAVELPRD